MAPQSDNPVEQGHDIVHGGSKPTTEVTPERVNKTAPLPEGLKEEVKDGIYSGAGDSNSNPPFHGSGKGGSDEQGK